MRRLMLAVAFLSFVLLPLASCIVHTPRARGRHYRSRNCQRRCVSYGHRRHCNRRCSVYRNGVCVSYRQVCQHTRYCARYRSYCR